MVAEPKGPKQESLAENGRALLFLVLLLGAALALLWARRSELPPSVSDDDFARVVIAQNWAESPRLDPSGTSWLPFPFWLQGVAMTLFGATLETARSTALAGALGATALLFFAGRGLGLSRFAAGFSAILPLWLTTLRVLAIAPVPEYLTAALIIAGAVAVAAPSRALPIFGALCLTAAAWSRYEAWPAVIAVGVWAGICNRRPWLTVACALGPALWMLHGVLTHGSALFFFHRVQAYKAALGADGRSALELWLSYPKAALMHQPFLWSGALAALLTSRGPKTWKLTQPKQALIFALSALLAGLIAGDVLGGAPTHHPERAVIALWFGAAFLAASALSSNPLSTTKASSSSEVSSSQLRASSPLSRLVKGTLAVAALSIGAYFEQTKPKEDFQTRPDAEAMGRLIRSQVPDDAPIVIATGDYSYFAVQAAAGHPSRFRVAISADPREKDKPHSLPAAVREARIKSEASYAVVPICVAPEAFGPPEPVVQAETKDLMLLRYAAPPR